MSRFIDHKKPTDFRTTAKMLLAAGNVAIVDKREEAIFITEPSPRITLPDDPGDVKPEPTAQQMLDFPRQRVA